MLERDEYLEKTAAVGHLLEDPQNIQNVNDAVGVFADIIHVPVDTERSALKHFGEFHDRYEYWGDEILAGLPVSMRLLGVLAESRQLQKQFDDLPEPSSVFIADMLSDVGKLDVEREWPQVVRASLTGDGWNRDKYELMKEHVVRGANRLDGEDAIPPDVVAGVASHHLFQEVSYSALSKDELTPQQITTARVLALTDFAMAAAVRSDRISATGQSLGARIQHQAERSFGAVESQETVAELARVAHDGAQTAKQMIDEKQTQNGYHD